MARVRGQLRGGWPALIVLGVGAIAAGGILYEDDRGTSPTRTRASIRPTAGNGDCLTALLADIDLERKATLPAPTINKTVIGPSEAKRGMIGLRLTDRGSAVGAIRLSYDPPR